MTTLTPPSATKRWGVSEETTEYISLPVNSVQYVNDKLLRVSAENAALRAEIDRLRVRCRQIDDEAYDYAEQIEQLKAEIDRLRTRENVIAQHEDTGRTWNGPRCEIPSRYFEVNSAEHEVERE